MHSWTGEKKKVLVKKRMGRKKPRKKKRKNLMNGLYYKARDVSNALYITRKLEERRPRKQKREKEEELKKALSEVLKRR